MTSSSSSKQPTMLRTEIEATEGSGRTSASSISGEEERVVVVGETRGNSGRGQVLLVVVVEVFLGGIWWEDKWLVSLFERMKL